MSAEELSAIQARIKARSSSVQTVRAESGPLVCGPDKQRRKYSNEPTVVDGVSFDSRKEARRYGELRLLQQAGEIHGLTLKTAYPCVINGVLVCKYIDDFSYLNSRGVKVIEDVKGYRGGKGYEIFRLKKKLVAALFSIKIVEI